MELSSIELEIPNDAQSKFDWVFNTQSRLVDIGE